MKRGSSRSSPVPSIWTGVEGGRTRSSSATPAGASGATPTAARRATPSSITSIMQKSASSGTTISQMASNVSSSEPAASETAATSASTRKRRRSVLPLSRRKPSQAQSATTAAPRVAMAIKSIY